MSTELILPVLRTVFPLFVVMGAGWAMSARIPFDEASLSRVLVDFFMPVLVFVSLYDSRVPAASMGDLLLAVLFLIAGLLLLARLYTGFAGIELREIALPVIFMNSGFIGFPLMQLWGGNEAMSIIIVFDQIYTLFLFSLGFLIIGGGFTVKGLSLSLRSPVLWAALTGFLFNLLRIPLPPVLLESFRFAGAPAPALAAFLVGASLAGARPRLDATVLWGVLLRIAAGFALGLATVWLFRLEGVVRTVVLVSSALPSAVFSYILPTRYGLDASAARSIVVLTTLAGIVTIPLSFLIAGRL